VSRGIAVIFSRTFAALDGGEGQLNAPNFYKCSVHKISQKVKVVLDHDMKAYIKSGGIAPLTLNLHAR